jgi:pentatricopeptide repeat protein
MKASTCVPDEITYNTLLKGCAKSKNYEAAMELFTIMKENTRLVPNEVTYNSIIEICVKTDRKEEVWALLDEMTAAKIEPDNYTFSTIAKICKSENDKSQLNKVL